jgi:prepilin-type N-terminal cleavage/methylation domain-containing protein
MTEKFETHALRFCGDKPAPAGDPAFREPKAGSGCNGFPPLDKATNFYPVRKSDNIGLSNGINQWPLQVEADRSVKPGVREFRYLTGFTLIEIMIVVVLIGIAAMIAVPMMSSAASMQIRSAANIVAADLEYAKSMAISRGQNYSVVFDKENESYSIKREGSEDPIPHPVKKGFDYIIDFRSDTRLDRVDIDDADFDPDSSQTITFDYLGSPYSGTGTSKSPLNEGSIELQADGFNKTISVEAVTGYISITD